MEKQPVRGRRIGVPEDASRLVTIPWSGRGASLDPVFAALEADDVVLMRDVRPDDADEIAFRMADHYGLRDSLETQAGFADVQGLRTRVGKYFMTVNPRDDYQFVTPHCEGNSSTHWQLAAFYCFENTTNGGETVLLNIDGTGEEWSRLRELVQRGRLEDGPLTRADVARARIEGLDLPGDLVKDDEHIVNERQSSIAGLRVVEALARPRKTYSRILQQEIFGYWHTVDDVYFDSARQFAALLEQGGLLRQPPGGLGIEQADSFWDRRILQSAIDYGRIFRCRLTHRLGRGDLVVLNNVSWAHSTANWDPDSGVRRVVVTFA